MFSHYRYNYIYSHISIGIYIYNYTYINRNHRINVTPFYTAYPPWFSNGVSVSLCLIIKKNNRRANPHKVNPQYTEIYIFVIIENIDALLAARPPARVNYSDIIDNGAFVLCNSLKTVHEQYKIIAIIKPIKYPTLGRVTPKRAQIRILFRENVKNPSSKNTYFKFEWHVKTEHPNRPDLNQVKIHFTDFLFYIILMETHNPRNPDNPWIPDMPIINFKHMQVLLQTLQIKTEASAIV